jgi:glycine cleavage system H protein
LNPETLLYAESHEWLHVEDDAAGRIGTVGISAFAIEELSDIVFINLPDVGTEVKAGQEFGEIESVKAVSDLYAPVGGEIIEVNSSLPDNLEILNQSAYVEGWMIKIRIQDESELSKLMDFAAYQRQCEQ